MKNIVTVVSFFCVINLLSAQKLDLNLIDKLAKMSFVSMDEYMIEGYGFKKLENVSDERTNAYARYFNNDFNSSIIIKVLNPKDAPNVVEIFLAKNFDIRDLKDDLLSRGYEYNGSNDYGYIVYEKPKSIYTISKEPNDKGITHIIVFTEW